MDAPAPKTEFEKLSWSVEGMDCGSCVKKITGALDRLPGVADVKVSMINETLSLRLLEDGTVADQIEQAVEKLGFRVNRLGEALDRAGSQSPGDCRAGGRTRVERGWYQTAKGRLVLLTGALLAGAWGTAWFLPGDVSRIVFSVACLLGLFPVARRAFAALRSGMPFTIEMLMTIAATGALFIGAAEEAALVIFLFAVGEILEGVASDRARAGIRALGNLVPKTALLEEDGQTREVDAAGLEVGQTVLIRPGDRIPADGVVAEGASGVDESPVTGESVPKNKSPGDDVFAGSINTEAALRMTVSRAAEDNTIARIIRLVEEAQEARAPTERFIDRFSRYYMPVVVGIALLVAIVPPLAMGLEWGTWIYRALALLLIGCPCALVISVPASIASSLSAGARRGLLMKGGAVIEKAARIEVVAFDKTGTLTEGRPQVTDVVPLALDSRDELLGLAASVENGSAHPLAAAVLSEAAKRGLGIARAVGAKVIPGRGVEALVDGCQVFVGSPRHAEETGAMNEECSMLASSMEAEGKTVAAVHSGGTLLGLIALRDQPREDAAAAVRQLKALGVRPVMLTGDNERTAAAIAGGLDMDHRAELLPDDKVAQIRELSGDSRLMMVGDGINDAPALASADVGVAMGSGTDVALETADAALLRNRVTGVAAKIRLARATMGNIRQNIVIALGLKAVFLVTSVLGLTGLWLAIMADTGATVLVTLNALRLLVHNPEKEA